MIPIPPALLGPMLKIVGALLFAGAVYGIGQWHGRSAIQTQWDAAISQQAIESAESVIHAAENTARIEAEYQRQLEAQAARVRVVTKEVKVYVESPIEKCVVTPEFERVFDAVSRMHDAGADDLPAAGSPAGAAVVLSGAALTDAAVLAAYEGAVVELFALWDTYAALRDWVRSSYAIASEGAGR